MMKKFFLSIIVFIIILSISVCAVDFTPQGNINLRSVYSIINGVDINASNFYGNFTGDLTGTASIATLWASVTSFASDWFYDSGNVLSFNETLMNSTIDARNNDTTYTSAEVYINLINTVFTFNETELNNTIDARDTDTTYTAGNGINISGTTFSVAGNTALTQDSDGLSVTADGIGDTQLTYNTGQALTTTSNPEFATLNTGQGNYELYSMDQDVLEKSEVVFAQINVTDNLTLNNNVWLRALNNAGTSFVNMFKVNTDDVIEAGANFSIGAIRIVEDSGVINLVDMSVSSTPAINTEEGYNFSIDGEPFLKIFAGADGSGGLKDKAIWISDNVSVKFDNGAKISVNSTCMSMYSPNGTGIIDVCD